MAESIPKKIVVYIPEEIVVEILLRLPAKWLVRCKCVCKQWRSLISDRAFAKRHLQKLKEGDLIPSQRIIIGGLRDPFKTVDYEALDGGGEGVVPHEIEPLQESRIVGSCDGLVCLINPFKFKFLIYNPTTRKYTELPRPDFVHQATYPFYGFGYDSQSDDYKIVGVKNDYKIVGVKKWKVAIFSLKSSCWRMIEFPFQEEYIECLRPAVYWKGALHWFVYVWNMNEEGEPKIMSFDLSEERFHQVLPVPQVDFDTRLLALGIHGANLFIYNTAQNARIQAWIRDEYGIEAPWTEWFSVDINGNKKIPLAYTRSGKIVCLMDGNRMILFNPQDNTCRDYPLGEAFITEYAVYLETSVSPYLGSGAVE